MKKSLCIVMLLAAFAGAQTTRNQVNLGSVNGSTLQQMTAGLDSTGTGVLANGMLCQFDDVAPAPVTENNFAPVRCSSRRALYAEGLAAIGAAPVGNPFPAGWMNVSGNLAIPTCSVINAQVCIPIGGQATAGADSVANTYNWPTTGGGSVAPWAVMPLIYHAVNGNWNRQGSMVTAADVAGGNVTAAGMMAQVDDTSPSSVTENQFGNVRMDAQKALRVNPEGMKATYHCSGIVTPAATPTDVIQITGSASKTVRILNVTISVETTAAGIAELLVNRKSAADTGGTSSAPTIGKNDTGSAAATAVCTVYTANPTVNGLVATVGARGVGGTTGPVAVVDYATRSGQAMVLRGTSELLAVNGNGDTLLAGEKWAYDIEWTEE